MIDQRKESRTHTQNTLHFVLGPFVRRWNSQLVNEDGSSVRSNPKCRAVFLTWNTWSHTVLNTA